MLCFDLLAVAPLGVLGSYILCFDTTHFICTVSMSFTCIMPQLNTAGSRYFNLIVKHLFQLSD